MSGMQREELLAIRERAGLRSQKALADVTGISASMFAAVETGQRNLSRESIEQIVTSLGLGDIGRKRLTDAMLADRKAQGLEESLADRVAMLERRVSELESAAETGVRPSLVRAADSATPMADPGPAKKKRTQGRRPSPPAGRDDG